MASNFLIPTSIASIIYKSIRSEGKYQAWMKRFIKPSVFYSLQSQIDLYRAPDSFFAELISTASSLGYSLNNESAGAILRIANKLSIMTLILYSSNRNLFSQNEFSIRSLWESLISKARLMIVFSFDNCHALEVSDIFFKRKINILAPVCPDYSYDKLPDGGHRYTFTDVNDGIVWSPPR